MSEEVVAALAAAIINQEESPIARALAIDLVLCEIIVRAVGPAVPSPGLSTVCCINRTWHQAVFTGVVPGFCGSVTRACGPCFAPQSAAARLVAFASSSGRRSEEPHVVVTRAARTAKNSTGHSRRDLLVYFW